MSVVGVLCNSATWIDVLLLFSAIVTLATWAGWKRVRVGRLGWQFCRGFKTCFNDEYKWFSVLRQTNVRVGRVAIGEGSRYVRAFFVAKMAPIAWSNKTNDWGFGAVTNLIYCPSSGLKSRVLFGVLWDVLVVLSARFNIVLVDKLLVCHGRALPY